MATASNKKASGRPSISAAPEVQAPPDHWILRGFDSVYRFLASLKLAVICILTLALVLAGATIFESFHGVAASRQYFYQNPAFAILLAFLGTNIFCAATIRFPWKKRQTGFVVTHIGLLIVLAGAFVSLRFSDEGQLGMAEGTRSDDLVRVDHAVIRVEKMDSDSGKTLKPYLLPFTPGAFSWETDRLKVLAKDREYQARVWISRASLASSALALVGFSLYWAIRRPPRISPVAGSALVAGLVGLSSGLAIYVAMTPSGPRRDVLTDARDPFVFAVNDYLRSSGDQEQRAEEDRDGHPVVKLSLLAQPPGGAVEMNALLGNGWFGEANPKIARDTKQADPALVVFQYARGSNAANIVDDFLHPPTNPLKDRAARFHYKDKSGKPRVYEWVLGDDLVKQTITLPDSDIAVTLVGFDESPLRNDDSSLSFRKATGDDSLRLAIFQVGRGSAKPTQHIAVASLPMAPNSTLDDTPEELVRIGYFHPPSLNTERGVMRGRKGQIEVLASEDGKFYWRGFGSEGLMGPPGPIAIGQKVKLATSKAMPMQLSLRLDEALPRGRIRQVYVPVELPRERRDDAIPAIQAEMTVDGVTRPLSLFRTVGIGRKNWTTVSFPSGSYRVSYDFDRRPFPFTIALKTFEPGKDPGSGSFATYRSDIELTDPELGLKDEPRIITMNEPLTHRQWTFYQSRFDRISDPETGQRDAMYSSLFQVHYDPAWRIVYAGCLFVVLGTFLQFYMRAGLFTDGGKLEQQRNEAKAAKKLAKANGTKPPADVTITRSTQNSEPVEDL
ncbi:MAG: ResB protein required for cytochrome c biosynthesis [Planctomycetota bacterium]|nr:ResB protein required for cytochrome c biosynthesis [Planctomycetota bacterium]